MKINKIMKKWGSSSAKEVFSRIISSPMNVFYTILFDGLFVFSLYVMGFLANNVLGLKPGISVLRIVYLICVIAAYSVFKFLILDITKSFFKNEVKSDYRRFWGFFLLNIIIILAMLMFIIVISFIAGLFVNLSSVNMIINGQGVPAFVIVEMIITMLVFYPLVNISHSLFAEGINAMKSLGNAVISTFVKFKNYSFTYLFFILTFFGMGIAFTLADIAANGLLRGEIFSAFYPAFLMFLVYFSIFAFYLVHIYNRIYFMNYAKNSKK